MQTTEKKSIVSHISGWIKKGFLYIIGLLVSTLFGMSLPSIFCDELRINRKFPIIIEDSLGTPINSATIIFDNSKDDNKPIETNADGEAILEVKTNQYRFGSRFCPSCDCGDKFSFIIIKGDQKKSKSIDIDWKATNIDTMHFEF